LESTAREASFAERAARTRLWHCRYIFALRTAPAARSGYDDRIVQRGRGLVAEFFGEGWPEGDAGDGESAEGDDADGDDADGEVDAGAALFGGSSRFEVRAWR